MLIFEYRNSRNHSEKMRGRKIMKNSKEFSIYPDSVRRNKIQLWNLGIKEREETPVAEELWENSKDFSFNS